MLVTGHCCWYPGRPAGGAVNACSAHRPLDADGQNLHTHKQTNTEYTMWHFPGLMFLINYKVVCVLPMKIACSSR